jgi:hypothetical protein
MSLLVLAYPSLARADYEWIQRIRARHDGRYYRLIEPHFTFVFSVSKVERKVFVEHVKGQARRVEPFKFVLRCALVVADDSGQFSHVFLVPDEGFSEIVRLHDALYTGALAPELRLDIPFIPHIGIGNSDDARECKRLADELNAEGFRLEGRIETLDVVSYENSTVQTVERIELGQRRQQ